MKKLYHHDHGLFARKLHILVITPAVKASKIILKSDLQGMRFEDNNAVISYFKEWVRTQPKNFWGKGNRTVVKTLEKCIEANGHTLKDNT